MRVRFWHACMHWRAKQCHPHYVRWATMSRQEQRLAALLYWDPLTVPENIRKTVEETNELCILLVDKYPHMLRHLIRPRDEPWLGMCALFIGSMVTWGILVKNNLCRKRRRQETDPSIIHDTTAKSWSIWCPDVAQVHVCVCFFAFYLFYLFVLRAKGLIY